MRRAMLDSDTVSYFLKRYDSVVSEVNDYLKHFDRLEISIITHYEISRGLLYKGAIRRKEEFEKFVRQNKVLPFDEKASHIAAEIYAKLREEGKLISEANILVAAIAIANDCVLVTNNIEHFERIPNLEVESWLDQTEVEKKRSRS